MDATTARHDSIRELRRGRSRVTSLALVVALAVTGLVAVAVDRAEALPSDVTVLAVYPVEGTTLLVSRTAANNPLDPPTFQVKGEIRLRNTGSDKVRVTGITTRYPGSSIPDSPKLGFFDDSDRTIEPGTTDNVRFWDGLQRDLPTPLPPTIEIELEVDDDRNTEILTFDLAFRDNAVDLGAHFFPASAEDLAPGEYWHWAVRHVVDAGGGNGPINPTRITDRYAVDMDVVAWDEAHQRWSNVSGGDGSSNAHHRVFGLPVYSMGDGAIIECYRGEPDEPPTDKIEDATYENGNGNSLVIRYGDDKVTLAHFKFGSIPEELCPTPDPGDPGLWPHEDMQDGLAIPVATGDELGQIGNTGASSAPHLHFQAEHVTDGTNTVFGVPMQFINVRAVADDTGINGLGGDPTLLPVRGMALHRNTLVLPNPCGFDPLPDSGGIEVSVHDVPAACWQDVFNLVTSRGYRPSFVDGFEVAGKTFFNGTFRAPGPASHAQHGLTEDEYEQLYDDLTDEGFRLHQVDSYRVGGAVRYAAIFEHRPGPAFDEVHGLDDVAFDQRLEQLADAGYVPVNVSAVEVNGAIEWTALFEQVPANGWTIDPATPGDWQDTFNVNEDAGRILTSVDAFDTGGGPVLVGVFVDPVGPNSSARHGLTSSEYQDVYDANFAAGRLTRATTGYDEGGLASFAGVWRGRPDTAFTETPDAISNQATATFAFAASNPFATFECVVDGGVASECQSPTTVTGLAEGTHTFTVRAVDRELIADLSPDSYSWLVDLTPPTIDVVAPPPGTKTVHGVVKEQDLDATTVVGWADVVVDVTDALSGVATVACDVDGAPIASTQVDSDTWTCRFDPDRKGEDRYDVQVTATDVAGNAASTSLRLVGVQTGKPAD